MTQIFTAGNLAMLILCFFHLSCRPVPQGRQEVSPRVHRIEIKDLTFMPNVINVALGDTVQWVNLDYIPHTATDSAGQWDSGQLNENDTWSMVVDSSLIYDCLYHPTMKGKIEVAPLRISVQTMNPGSEK